MRGGRAAGLAAGLLMLMLAANGCTRFQSDYESGHAAVDESELGRLQDMSEALDLLGPPTKLGRAGTGTVFVYENVSVRELQFGVNLSYEWLSIFKAVIAKGDADIETLEIVFDDAGAVVSHSIDAESRTVGYGGALDLIIKLVPIVDTDDYTALSPQHDWGHGLSEPLPVMLNAPYSVRQGVGGVERVGTPDKVGQETLGGAP
jgi:hypothetical protein